MTDLVEALEPASFTRPPDRRVLEEALARLEEAVELESRGPAAHRLVVVPGRVSRLEPVEPVERLGVLGRAEQPRVPHRARPRAAVLLAVALVIAAIVAIVIPGGSGSSDAAAAVLKRLSLVAKAQAPTPPLSASEYLFAASDNLVKVCVAGGVSYCELVPEHRDLWIGADRSGRLLQTYGTPTFPTASDRAAWVSSGEPNLNNSLDIRFAPGQASDGPVNLDALPTSAAKLGQEIASRRIESGPPGAAEDFVQIGDLLRVPTASPALRAALFQVAAGLKGVELLGSVTDHSGRHGVGLAYVEAGVEDELVVDPDTAALLGEATIAVGSAASVPVGTVEGWSVYEPTAVVSSETVTPSGTLPFRSSAGTGPGSGASGAAAA